MEEDIKVYIEILRKRWKLVLFVVVATAVVAYIASQFIQPTYQASSLVVSVAPRDLVQFDERFQNTLSTQPIEAYLELATSDQILKEVLSETQIDGLDNVEQLRPLLKINTASKSATLRFVARADEPDKAAQIANVWADIFVTRANEIFGDKGVDQVEFFADQLKDADRELATTEKSLIEFQSINRTQIISNTLGVYTQQQIDLLDTQQSLKMLKQDVDILYDQLVEKQDDSPVRLADQLMALSLQMKVLGIDPDGPLQIQLDSTSVLTGNDTKEQVKYLDNLDQIITAKTEQVENTLEELDSTILNLQYEMQIAETENKRLLINYQIAEETYTSLARKVDEEQITSQDTTNGVRLASRAVAPQQPISPKVLANTAVAAMLGLIMGIMLAFVIEYMNGVGGQV